MAQTYRTKDGDVLDELVWNQYPKRRVMGTVEKVLAANYGLAEYGPYLPQGLLITFPDLPPEPPRKMTVNKYWSAFIPDDKSARGV